MNGTLTFVHCDFRAPRRRRRAGPPRLRALRHVDQRASARQSYAASTLIFVVEDDAQDGADHVDAHRSTAYVVGPYVKQNAVISTPYNTINMVRTIEAILGLDPLNMYDGTAATMSDLFDTTMSPSAFTYTATKSDILAGTTAGLGLGALHQAEAQDRAVRSAPIAPKDPLKITRLETFLVKPRWLFLKVHTNAGIVGLGEQVLEGRALTCAAAVVISLVARACSLTAWATSPDCRRIFCTERVI